MIVVPASTIEKPLTAIDYIAHLEQCSSLALVSAYAEAVPDHIREDERFTRAVASRLAALKGRKA